jgi:hypothetical protein
MSKLYDLFTPGIIPHNGWWRKEGKFDNIAVSTDILVSHCEIPRKEYNYEWNTDGLRSIEFAKKPPIVALGCSLTLAQGLPVELRWSDLLSKKINMPVGNISYSGASIMQLVSSFLGMINQYKYLPEYVICNMPPFERFYFIDGHGEKMKDYWLGNKATKTKDSAPWDYGATIPYEWVYYQNLEAIKTLEVFCKTNNIKLIWSNWSALIPETLENIIINNFENYHKDPTRKLFPIHFDVGMDPKNVKDLPKYFKMKNWDSIKCHENEFLQFLDIFEHAYDYHKIPVKTDKKITRCPHPGLHRQLHWVEFYYDLMIQYGFKQETSSSTF